MKEKLKENLFIIIPFIILLVVLFINTNNYIKKSETITKKDIETREKCKLNVNPTEEERIFCNYVEKTKPYKSNFYHMFNNIFIINMNNLSFIMYIFITISTINYLCKFFKNNGFNNYLTRINYKKLVKKLLISSSKSILMLPLLAIIAFIICYFYTGGFDYKIAIDNNLVSWNIDTIKYPIVFMATYILRLGLISTIYDLIAIIICRKNHQPLNVLIVSYLLFICIGMVINLFLDKYLCQNLLKSNFGMLFNIIYIFKLYDHYGLFLTLLVPLIFVLILLIIVYKKYNDKEQMIIDCEKHF